MVNKILLALLIREQMHIKRTIRFAERGLMNDNPIGAATHCFKQRNRSKVPVKWFWRIFSAALWPRNLHRICLTKIDQRAEFDRRYLMNDVEMISSIKIVDHWSDTFQPDTMTSWIEISLVNLLIERRDITVIHMKSEFGML